ncbi:hypothetical protein S83_042372 [Arachis hypogaea]|nr:SWI/SNF complex subunit SWI3D [Arachis hypogaea]
MSLPPPPSPPPPFIFLPVLPSLSPSFQVSDDCIQIVEDSERGFGADAVTLAEEIWKACERESLESSIEAAFKAIRSRGTDSHVPSHCEWLSVHRNFVRHYLAFTNRHRSGISKLSLHKPLSADSLKL